MSSSRRDLLKVLGLSALALPVLDACGPNVDQPAGTVAETPVGTLRAVAGTAYAIGRDANGIYGMSLTCTHQACSMADGISNANKNIVCSCHGSVFDLGGSVVRGPANRPLQHFAVSVDGAGNITLHTNQQVDASTRTKV
jgi:Rieske Fe-S protein